MNDTFQGLLWDQSQMRTPINLANEETVVVADAVNVVLLMQVDLSIISLLCPTVIAVMRRF